MKSLRAEKRWSSRQPARAIRSGLGVVILGAFASAVSAQTLSNTKIEAKFGERGLVSIRDLALRKSLTFGKDDWSVTVNGQDMEGARLESREVVRRENSLCYLYRSGRFSIELVYELRPGWRFVSKQLLVSDTNQGDYRVGRVVVLRGRLNTPIDHEHVIQTAREAARQRGEQGDFGALLRFRPAWGAFFLVQNPFLTWQRDGEAFSLGYSADMPWKSEYGPFRSDRGCIGTYELTGTRTPEYMESHPAWGIFPNRDFSRHGMDLAEVNAYVDCVRAFLLYVPQESVRIHVPWCENDYQIDVATDEGVAEWKRIVDTASDLGIRNMLYTCQNSTIAKREESADAWSWEYLLWLNMGPKIRRNEWDPKTDTLPARTRHLLDYAGSKNVKLMAYVYPSLPFEQNKAWLSQRHPSNPQRRDADLGYRAYQDWLIEHLLAFKRRTGISGYSFDYTSLGMQGTSRYAQWHGWRRVLETLRRESPDIVIDGRQTYHRYGPWGWLAGTYPHPTAGDEQPESFEPFPDLHFDRSSATHQRYTAYWFRNTQFCPVEIMPGFITHQTPRKDAAGTLRLDRFNVRDWDYLGWKFSLFSSIATAPFSHCVDMIPARDTAEFKLLPQEDKEFIKRWLAWTDENAATLRHMRTIIGPPAIGHVDGTAAIDGDHGFIFLFNPNHRKAAAWFPLDKTIGLTRGDRFLLRHLYPEAGKLVGKPKAGTYRYGDAVSLTMDGTTALVLELIPAESELSEPLLFNARGRAELEEETLVLSDVVGEIGKRMQLQALVPAGQPITAVSINGGSVPFARQGDLLTMDVAFGGSYFSHAQQIGHYDPASIASRVNATFNVPKRIFEQLEARRQRWPVPWTERDYQCTWLVPERLLLYIQIAEPDWEMNVDIRIDGQPVEVRKAYSSISPGMLRQGKGHNTFVGFYVDVSDLEADREHQVELTLPELKPGQFQGIFFENVETQYTEEVVSGR